MTFCLKPYVRGKEVFDCYQCLPCRVRRRQIWTCRLLLESKAYQDNVCFLTLTYDDEHLPEGGNLVPKDLQNFIKRFRLYSERAGWGKNIRYYAVGEYGDRGERPHYHLILYGARCRFGPFVITKTNGGTGHVCKCRTCLMIAKTWPFGHFKMGFFSAGAADYVAGYATKKLTGPEEVQFLNGRHKEFTRQSLKPGIGHNFIPFIVEQYKKYDPDNTKYVDVKGYTQFGRRKLPYGRYMKRKIRRALGRSENAPQKVLDDMAADPFRKIAFAYADCNYRTAGKSYRALVKEAFAAGNEQAARNMAARVKLRRRG